MGHDNVKVLDGGFPKWKREGRAVETGPARPAPKFFTAIANPALVRDFAAVMDIVKGEGGTAKGPVDLSPARTPQRQSREARIVQIVDARGAGRFLAQEPEPR